MKETQNTLPNWFEGEVYEEGGTVETHLAVSNGH